MVRSAGLFLFIGAVGFLNFYDDLMSSSDDDGDETFSKIQSKQLQKKFGVKEKRSVELPTAVPQQAGSHLARQLESFHEELIEHYRMPLSGITTNPIDCRKAESAPECSCLRLLCFGGSGCKFGSLSDRVPNADRSQQRRPPIRCRQTTIDTFLMCECRQYVPL